MKEIFNRSILIFLFSISSILAGYVSVSDGVDISPNPAVLNSNFTVSFTLKETSGSSITFEDIAVAILKADGTHLFDLKTYGTTTFTANMTWSQSPSGKVYNNPAGDYQAVIRGKLSGGNWFDFSETGQGNNLVTFQVSQPSPPTLNYPSGNQIIGDIEFSWNQSTGASRYRLKICTDASMSNQISGSSFEPSIGATSYTVLSSKFNVGQTYYWQVGAIAPDDDGGWGDYGPASPWSITINKPTPPSLISPNGNIDIGDITFSWNQSNGAGRYRLKICTDANMSTQISGSPYEPNSGLTSYTVPASNFTTGQTYYWQVGAIAPDDVGGWGDYGPATPWSITINKPVLTLISPTKNIVISDPSFTFKWYKYPGAIKYELYVDNNPGLGSPEIAKEHIPELVNLTDTTYTISANWLSNNTNYWTVFAVMSDGSKIQSEVDSFFYEPQFAGASKWLPLFRTYHSTDKDHFYCLNDNHYQDAIKAGYQFENFEGYIRDIPAVGTPDTFPIYRLYKNDPTITKRKHYYTTDPVDKNDRIIQGFTYEGITGYTSKTQRPGLIPMYHSYLDNSTISDNFYTISEFETNYAHQEYGFNLIDTLGYVSLFGNNLPFIDLSTHAKVGSGINTFTGNNNYSSEDCFSIPAGRMPLNFSFFYNSMAVLVPDFNNTLGMGWSHTYNAFISEFDSIYVSWPNGAINIYSQSSSKSTTPGIYDSLVKVSNTVYKIHTLGRDIFTFKRFNNDNITLYLEKITDKNGNEIKLTWNNTTRLLEMVEGPYGRSFSFTHYTNEENKHLLKSVQDNTLNRTVSFKYDGRDLISYTNSESQITTYTYDTSQKHFHRLESITFPEKNQYTFSYDQSTNKVTKVEHNSIPKVTLSYSNSQTLVSGANGITQTHYYSQPKIGVLDKVQTPLGSLTYERKDPVHKSKPTKITDAENHVTLIEYNNPKGFPTKITQKCSSGDIVHTLNYKSNEPDLIEVYTDPNGNPTNYSYYTQGNIKTVTDAVGNNININYNNEGLINSLTQQIPSGTMAINFGYNSHGDLTSVSSPTTTSEFTYDQVGRLKSSKIGGKDIISSANYLSTDLLEEITKPLGYKIGYTYDDNKNLVKVTNANSKSTQLRYEYNKSGLLNELINLSGKSKTFSYDDNNLVESMKDFANNVFNYSYDEEGLLKGISGSISDNITRNKNGDVTLHTHNGKTQKYTYDELGRITAYTDRDNNIVKYTFDKNSNILSIEYPGWKVVKYTYNKINKITAISWDQNTFDFTYYSGGYLKDITFPNGVVCSYTYDNSARLSTMANISSKGDTVNYYHYEYSAQGKIEKEIKKEPLELTGTLPLSRRFEYNDANQLTKYGTIEYQYDDNGNIKKRSGSNHDADFTFSSLNQLTNISGAYPASYEYDGSGNRCYANKNGKTIKYVLSGVGSMSNILIENNETYGKKFYYIYGPGLLARVDNNDKVHYYHSDLRGSVVAMTDKDENITHKYAYDSYGKVITESETGEPNQFRYIGKYGVMDEGNGLYYMRARYYDVESMRFISVDPIWGDNLYAYAGGNPVEFIDPSGKNCYPIIYNIYINVSIRKYNGEYLDLAENHNFPEFINTVNYCGPSDNNKISDLIHQDANFSCYLHDKCFDAGFISFKDCNKAMVKNAYKETGSKKKAHYYKIGINSWIAKNQYDKASYRNALLKLNENPTNINAFRSFSIGLSKLNPNDAISIFDEIY